MSSHKPSRESDAATPASWIDKVIEIDAGHSVPVRLYGRRDVDAETPLVVHFHGGAFVSGSLTSGSTVARLLADAAAVVVSLDYPLAPAAPFPHAVEVGHAVLSWAHKHRARLAGRSARLFVAGEEAGGNLAAAVALMSRDRHGPPLAGQLLLSPMLDPCLGTHSLREVEAGPIGCRFADGWRQYLCRAADADHPYAAPASSMRLAGLPPTLLVTAVDDPMRDEAHAYAKRLRDAGMAVHEFVVPGATGWPCTLFDPQSVEAEWAAALHVPFVRFLGAPVTFDERRADES